MRCVCERTKPVQAKLMLKDNTLTFENAYKEAVAEELAAK